MDLVESMFKTSKYWSESFTKLTLQGFIAAKTWKNYIVPYQNKLFKNLTHKCTFYYKQWNLYKGTIRLYSQLQAKTLSLFPILYTQ